MAAAQQPDASWCSTPLPPSRVRPVPLRLLCNVQQRQPSVLMRPQLGGKDKRHVSMSSQRPTAHASAPINRCVPWLPLLPTAELPGEREYLCRLAADRSAAAAARAVGEESTAAAITASCCLLPTTF